MRYDPSSEIDPEEEADAWYEEDVSARNEVLADVYAALGPYAPDNMTHVDVISAVEELAGRVAGLEK